MARRGNFSLWIFISYAWPINVNSFCKTVNVHAYLHPAVRLQVVLTGVPLVRGLLTLTGCRLTALGVTWKQPWTPLVGAGRAASLPVSQDAGGLAQVIA